MADATSREAIDRRRIQNRVAQRRFRPTNIELPLGVAEKKQLQKSVPSGETSSNVTGFMYLEMPPQEFDTSSMEYNTTGNSHFNNITFENDYPAFTDRTMLEALGSAGFLANPSLLSPATSQPTSYGEEGGSYFPISTLPSVPMELEGHSSSDIDVTTTSCPVADDSSSPDPSPTPFEGLDPHHGTKCRDAWMNPLHAAAQRGRDRIVRLLLQHGSEPDETDSDGLTPLMHAVVGGHVAVATLLLSHGAQVVPGALDRRRTASTPLHLAVLHQRENLLRLFLSHMAQQERRGSSSSLINSHDEMGRTPLFIAIDLNFEPGVVLLLQHGADLKQKLRIPP
ncbi:ankyrin repeat-containing domain protein [Apiospora saccharicola]|uniref:Ankyrin repeat-containing domain protein n=1 Tax=Apiospora saccharicola TaxID=335842 RepID=A0ABR1VBD1_9PEZI